MSRIVDVPVVHATRDNLASYGQFIDTEVPAAGLAIPFYKGSVEEGHTLPFAYHGNAVIRTARIHPGRSGDITWLERHMRTTQLLVGLGDAPFAMVLGRPCGGATPELEHIKAFVFPPGHGIMLHLGTWHDFPMAIDRPITVLTANSEEVVAALASQQDPDELDRGDVFKIDILRRTGTQLRVAL